MLTGFASLALFAAALQQVPVTLPPPVLRAPQQAPKADLVRVALDTSMGRIILELDHGRAPITTDNFLAYLDKGWLDGQPFYRAMPYGEGGLIQGGVRDGDKQLPPIDHEPTALTGIRNKAGTIALANIGAGTARSDFFIMTVDIPAFDSAPGQPGFAAFGHVVEGMDVVQAILAAPTDPELGEGVMKGQMLADPVIIEKASRIEE